MRLVTIILVDTVSRIEAVVMFALFAPAREVRVDPMTKRTIFIGHRCDPLFEQQDAPPAAKVVIPGRIATHQYSIHII
jgi:hypothetical protein